MIGYAYFTIYYLLQRHAVSFCGESNGTVVGAVGAHSRVFFRSDVLWTDAL